LQYAHDHSSINYFCHGERFDKLRVTASTHVMVSVVEPRPEPLLRRNRSDVFRNTERRRRYGTHITLQLPSPYNVFIGNIRFIVCLSVQCYFLDVLVRLTIVMSNYGEIPPFSQIQHGLIKQRASEDKRPTGGRHLIKTHCEIGRASGRE